MIIILICFLILTTTKSSTQNIDLATYTGNEITSLAGTDLDHYFGYSVSSAGDFNGDGIDDILIGVPVISPSNAYAGRAYVIFGDKNGIPEIDFLIGPTPTQGYTIFMSIGSTYLAWSVSNAGDVNGDSIDDIIIGDIYYNGKAGAVFVIFGSRNPGSNINLNTINLSANGLGFIVYGESPNNFFGVSVSSAGDFDGDGVDDFIVGAYGAPGTGMTFNGAAYVIFGRRNVHTDIMLSNAAHNSLRLKIESARQYEFLGASVSTVGDFNDDGVDDVVIGTWCSLPPLRDDPGISYVIFGSRTRIYHISVPTGLTPALGLKILGIAAGDQIGRSISKAGDINGDGVTDLVVGGLSADVPGKTDAGIVYVIYGGKTNVADINLATPLSSSRGFKITGAFTGGGLGDVVSNAGDFNGDGVDDIMIRGFSAPLSGSANNAHVYLIFGHRTGNTDIDLGVGLTTAQGFKIEGVSVSDIAETSLRYLGDVNGDNGGDIIVGACTEYDPSGASRVGRVYIFYGTPIPLEEVPAIVEATNVVAGATYAVAMVLAFFNSNTIGALWFCFLIEMLQYIKYMQIEYPPRLKLMIEQQGPELISIDYISSVPENLQEEITKYPLPEKFELNVLHSSFLVNFWPALIMLLLIIFSTLFVIILEHATRSRKTFHKIIMRIKQTMKWNYLLAIFTGQFIDIALFTSLELRTTRFGSFLEGLSCVLCLLINIIAVLVLIVIYRILRKLYKAKKNTELTKDPNYIKDLKSQLKDFEVTFESFEDDSFAQQSYMLIFTIRLYIFFVIIAYLFEYPLAQAIMINIIELAMLAYLGIKRPFKETRDKIESIVQEIILQIVNTCVLGLALGDAVHIGSEESRAVFGDIIIISNVAFILIGAFYVLVTAILSLRDLYKTIKQKYKNKKNAQHINIIQLQRDNIQLANAIGDSSFTNNNDSTLIHLSRSMEREKILRKIDFSRGKRFKSRQKEPDQSSVLHATDLEKAETLTKRKSQDQAQLKVPFHRRTKGSIKKFF